MSLNATDPPFVRYTDASGNTRDLSVVGGVQEDARGEQSNARVNVPWSEWSIIESRVDKINDEFELWTDGAPGFAGRLVDAQHQGGEAELQIGSWEEDARDAEPTDGGTRFTNVTDDVIASDAVGRVSTLSEGTVEETTTGFSMVFPRSSPAGMLRSLARSTAAWVRYNPDKTVDYQASIGRDRSGVETQILSEKSGTVEKLLVTRDNRDEFTHLLVLGAGEGDAQITASATSANYSTGRKVWRRVQDKEVVKEAQADKLAESLMSEADNAPRFLHVEATNVRVSPPPDLGDKFKVQALDQGTVNDDLWVVRREQVIDASGVQYNVELSNRPQHEEREAGEQERQISRFRGGYQGVSVPVNDSGGRQPVDDGLPYTMHVDYPADVVKELRAKLLVEGLAYRAYSKGAKSGGGSTETTEGGGGATETTQSGGQHRHTMFSLSGPPHSGISDSGYFCLTDSFDVAFVNIPAEDDIGAVPDGLVTDSANGTHTHDVEIDDHTHDVTIPNHAHDPEPGIIEDFSGTKFFPKDIEIDINGTAVTIPSGLANVDGTEAFQEEVDIKGLLQSGFNKIEVKSSQLGHIRVAIGLDLFRQTFESS